MSGKNFPDIGRGDVRLVDLDEDFGEGGVDVHRLAELSQGGAEGDVGGHLLHEVGGMGSEDVGAEDAALTGFGAQLHHALCLIHRQSLAVGAVEGFVTLIGSALFLQLVLTGAYAGGFRCGEDGGGHHVETDMILDAEDAVHDVVALHLGGVSEHLTTVDIADGITFTI